METDRLIQLTKAAILGYEPDDLADDEREKFYKIKAEVEDMEARGITPDLPYEL